MNRAVLWGGVGTLLGVSLTLGIWQRATWHAWPASPYGLTVQQEASVTAFFATAARHHQYEVTATRLHQWISSKQQVLMIDVRQAGGPKGYRSGHIRGAINIPFQQFGRLLPTLSLHEPIVVMCYDGNGGEMAPVILRLLGYQAYGLRDGVAQWNPRLDVWPHWAAGRLMSWPLVQGPGTVWTAAPVRGGDHLSRNTIPLLQRFFSSANHPYPPGYAFPWTIDAATLAASLTEAHPPLVIDLRSASAYRKGHIAGSIDIPYADLGGSLHRINPTRQVVLVSQSLQRAAEANAVLRLLGYQSFVLQRGLASWSRVEDQVPPPHHYSLATSS